MKQCEGISERKLGIVNSLATILLNSKNWFWLSFILMLPILGMILSILILFGQRPDSVI